MNLESIFENIYVNNTWEGHESRSGPGSGLIETVAIRRFLEYIIIELNIKSILDVPCGDFNWMATVDLKNCYYEGWDVVDMIVHDNLMKYPDTIFKTKNIIEVVPPSFDLILCRDLLGHLSLKDGVKILDNFKSSCSKYLLATTYIDEENVDCKTGGWRRVVLTKHPYNLGRYEKIIQDGIEYPEKKAALWKLY